MTFPIRGIPEIPSSTLSFRILRNVDDLITTTTQRVVNASGNQPTGTEPDYFTYYVLAPAAGLFLNQQGKVAVKIEGGWYFYKTLPGEIWTDLSDDTEIIPDISGSFVRMARTGHQEITTASQDFWESNSNDSGANINITCTNNWVGKAYYYNASTVNHNLTFGLNTLVVPAMSTKTVFRSTSNTYIL